MDHQVVNDYTHFVPKENDSIRVIIRAKPVESDSAENIFVVSEENNKRLSAFDPSNRKSQHEFLFDDILWTNASQAEVFDKTVKDLVDHCFQGYNGCCFAYGQTGSGKTHTMFGSDKGKNSGLIHKASDLCFEKKGAFEMTENMDCEIMVSFVEIYCDELRDLSPFSKLNLNDPGTHLKPRNRFEKLSIDENIEAARNQVRICEDTNGKVFVNNLHFYKPKIAADVARFIELGQKERATEHTKMNSRSSRSHTIFSIQINLNSRTNLENESRIGVLNLVDLAGSERLGKTESEGQRLKEALYINTSLSALGKVIIALDPSMPHPYIPYRESKLTRILQDSLGGNSRTCVIGTLNPIASNYEECLSTLHFVNRCRNVVNKPTVNYKNNELKAKEIIIKRLNAEILRLRILVAVIIERKNKQMEDILNDLGFKKFKMLRDGRIQLADGRTIGSKFDFILIEQEAAKMLEKSGSEFDISKLIKDTLRGLDAADKENQRALNGNNKIESDTLLEKRMSTLKDVVKDLKLKLKTSKLKTKHGRKEKDKLAEGAQVKENELRHEIQELHKKLIKQKRAELNQKIVNENALNHVQKKFVKTIKKLSGYTSRDPTSAPKSWFTPRKKFSTYDATILTPAMFPEGLDDQETKRKKDIMNHYEDVMETKQKDWDTRKMALKSELTKLKKRNGGLEKSFKKMKAFCTELVKIFLKLECGEMKVIRENESDEIKVDVPEMIRNQIREIGKRLKGEHKT